MMTTSSFYGHMNVLPNYMYGLDYPSKPDTVLAKQENIMEHHSAASSLSLAPVMENTFISAPPISTSCNTPTSTRFLSQPVTKEQELYAQGFLNALKQIQTRSEQEDRSVSNMYSQSNALISSYGSLSNVANTYVTASTSVIPTHLERTLYNTPESGTGLPYSSHEDLRIASAPYHIGSPASFNCSPATIEADIYDKLNGPMGQHGMFRDAMAVVPDMKTQEQLKTERKKARNRVAAKKCRQKRLVQEASQHEKVIELKAQYNKLQSERATLKDSIAELKKQLTDHLRKGCQIDLPNTVNSRKRAAL